MMRVTSQTVTGLLSRSMLVLLLVLVITAAADGKQRQHHIAREGRSLLPGVGALTDIARWRTLTFDFEGNQTKEQEYRNSGRYDPASILPVDADVIGGRVYVTTPLFKLGAPATFSVATSSRVQEPALRPFPSWDAHATSADALTSCNTQIVSVFRFTKLTSDENTLYLIDSGVVDIMSTFHALCPPKIVTIDVASATILDTTEIDKVYCNSLYVSIQVEQTSDDRRVAYTADVTGSAVAVTDLSTGRSHRVLSQYYHPTPGLGLTTIAGVRSFLMDGVFNLGVADGSLYSWAFASDRLNKVASRVLRNASDEEILDLTVQTLVPGRRAGPAGAFGVDPPGRRLFFGIAEQEAFYCWDTRKSYQQIFFRLLAQDTERLQFFSGVKVSPSNDQLLVVTNRYHKFQENLIDEQSVNFRVMTMNIRNLQC